MAAASSQYFSEEPSAASRRRAVTLALPDLTMRLATDRGVFSAAAVDPGTRLLLMTMTEVPLPGTGDLLDLGCGYGPIALTMARRAPGATVWAVDVNARARELCRENAVSNGLDNVRVVSPVEVPSELRFAAIWSNPPIRIGKDALHDLLQTWLARLKPGGIAALVVQRNLGADSLAAWLAEHGHEVGRIRSRAGYRVLGVR